MTDVPASNPLDRVEENPPRVVAPEIIVAGEQSCNEYRVKKAGSSRSCA